MALNLLNSFGKKGVNYGLATRKADVEDTDFTSKYFVLSEFSQNLSAGKNAFTFNGSKYLKDPSEIFIECIDSQGQPLFIEMATYADVSAQVYAYKEGTAWVFSVHVYNDTADGIGKLTLYGMLGNNKTVKWSRNVTIDKTLNNTSKVRFYLTPKLEVESVLVPVLNSAAASSSIITKTLSGKLHGLAISPPKDTNLPTTNKRNIDIDYRLTVDSPPITRSTADVLACNSQMDGATVHVNINRIQQPFSTYEIIPTEVTGTFIIGNVLNNTTVQVTEPYYYKDNYGNYAVTNIVDADYTITYPYVTYNNTTSSYLTTNIGGIPYIVQQSYADITYRNIRAFSGYVARHKVYRKSLLSNADFSIIADEPITINEVLRDNLTQNKYYELLGQFYNDEHIARYWFTSSNNLALVHSPDVSINAVLVSSPTTSLLAGNDYIMVKNDSVNTNRDAIYVPFDNDQFLATSGSAYDSNFMEFKANVQYIIEVSTTILKNPAETSAGLEFYLTSSVPNARLEQAFTNRYGLRVATIASTTTGVSSQNVDNQIFFFTPANDIYGTLVIVPYRCQAYLKNISFRVYGDGGFSPDVFTTRIPWSVSTANESFEIKSELFDINNNLIYSDLRVLASFDASGSSLLPYIPGGGSVAGDLFISGNLLVSKSIEVMTGNITIDQGQMFIPNITVRPGAPPMSASRFLSVRHDTGGELAENPVVDITSDSTYLYLSLGNTPGLSTPGLNTITTRQSMASLFDASSGRRIYYNGLCVAANKIIDSGSYS